MTLTQDVKKFFAAGLVGASMLTGATSSVRAEVDYDGIKYLGGGDKVDINNANIRAYIKIPGMYPNAAGKIVTNGPYKAVGDLYNIPGLSSESKEAIKKAESRFVVLPGKPEYEIDRINNGKGSLSQPLLASVCGLRLMPLRSLPSSYPEHIHRPLPLSTPSPQLVQNLTEAPPAPLAPSDK